ncbi:hypothetical protein [Cryptobacterium curtum]|uniref:hypothetical protein n=1 Tax=Cryptobacterium curtum TaxID=84163 RepID=UPI00248E09DC|nr:hypothetical protein [Cryptobacterium curtum]
MSQQNNGGQKNPYALKRTISGLICLASLVVYLIVPGEAFSWQKIVTLLVFFALIMVVTFFQQEYRSWQVQHRNPDSYDEAGRYHKDRDI